jgi:hypothetical protein
LLTYHHDGPALEKRGAADDGRIVAIEAVAVDFLEIGEQALDVVEGVGTLGMPG